MKTILFIARRYISRILIATVLTYVYLTNASPSCEGKLEKNSPAFFAQEIESANEADDQTNSELEEANQE